MAILKTNQHTLQRHWSTIEGFRVSLDIYPNDIPDETGSGDPRNYAICAEMAIRMGGEKEAQEFRRALRSIGFRKAHSIDREDDRTTAWHFKADPNTDYRKVVQRAATDAKKIHRILSPVMSEPKGNILRSVSVTYWDEDGDATDHFRNVRVLSFSKRKKEITLDLGDGEGYGYDWVFDCWRDCNDMNITMSFKD